MYFRKSPVVLPGMLLLLLSACHQGKGPVGPTGKKGAAPVPVEVAPVRRETIELRRAFTGSLEAPDRFVVAPKVGGRVTRLAVRLADSVTHGQVVATLDAEEFRHAVDQALAESAVAEASHIEATSRLDIADRELRRVRTLRERGVETDARLDEAESQILVRKADVAVAAAQMTRTKAALAAARARLSYTEITADWSGDGARFVAERHVNEGDTVSANTPLLTIVSLDPIQAVIFVNEKDYGLLEVGRPVIVKTDAFPQDPFEGRVARIAPVFSRNSRQARVEIELANPQRRLKPGMFVRAEVLLDQAHDALTAPLSALVDRDGQTGVFVISESEDVVSWRPVKIGIRGRDRVQIIGDVTGRVVTMGQQLLDDGRRITIPQSEPNQEYPTQ